MDLFVFFLFCSTLIQFAKICNSNLTLNLASLSIKLYFIFGSSFQMGKGMEIRTHTHTHTHKDCIRKNKEIIGNLRFDFYLNDFY